MIRSLLAGAVALILLPAILLSEANAGAAKLVTSKGASLEGQILAGNVNTLTINLDGGGYTIVPRAEIEQISISVEGGEVIEGTLHEWRDGICTIRSGNSLVTIEDDVVTAVTQNQVVKSAVATESPAPPELRIPPAPIPPTPVDQVPPSAVVNKPTM
jgi:hypothetical protein